MQQRRTWFVTGCSSGLGRAMAEVLVASDHNAVITARRVEQIKDLESRAPDRILALPVDISNEKSVFDAIAQATARFGKVDVVVNNAGVGLIGSLEECSYAEIDQVFRTNVHGTLNVVRAVLPQMRERGDGFIITMSSIGGVRAGPGLSAYNASKFALEGFMESLDHEVGQFGVKVIILEPGAFRTDFRVKSIARSEKVLPAYASTSGKRREGIEAGYPPEAGDPAQAAQLILKLADMEDPPLRLPIGADCVSALKKKLEYTTKELARWEHLSLSCGGSESAMANHAEAIAGSKRK